MRHYNNILQNILIIIETTINFFHILSIFSEYIPFKTEGGREGCNVLNLFKYFPYIKTSRSLALFA